jgi:hypothetical protein
VRTSARRALPFRRITLVASALAVMLVTLLAGRPARAQQSTLNLGRAGAEFFAACPNYLSQNCTLNACGHQVVWNSNQTTVAVPDLGIQPTTNYQSVANTINALCGQSAGDGFLATGGSQHVQNAQVEGVARALGPTKGNAGAGASYSAGGFGELGNNTYGASIPVNYAYRLSSGSAISNVGFVSFAHQLNANQGAISGAPAYAWALRNGEGQRVLGLGAYVPLSLAVTTLSGVNGALVTWGAGGGAIATGTLPLRGMTFTYGAGAALRATNGGVALPLSVLVRVEQPLDLLFHLFSTFATLSYGNDYLNAGSEYWVLGAGGALGKYEFGYRGFYSGYYVAHTLGFSIRKDLMGAEAFEHLPPPEEEHGKPVGPTPPVPPTGPTPPVSPPGPTPPVPQLPPPPVVPPAPPECQTDMDCPGDLVCEEARCLPPL